MSSWSSIKLGSTSGSRFNGYELADAGLVVHGAPSLAHAGEVGTWLAQLERRSPRWLGMWYLDITERFPGTYSQLLDPEIHDERTLAEYARVVRKVAEWEPELSFRSHQAVAALDGPSQREILTRARSEGLTSSEVRQEVRRVSSRVVAASSARGKFRVAYLSPNYTKTTVAELCELDIPGTVLANAAVFLWVEERYRDDIVAVYEAWDVRRVGTIIWNMQVNSGPSSYMATKHQYLLWLVRGRCSPDNLVPLQESIVSCRAPEPGGRPEVFRKTIDRLYDHGRKVEFYAKHERKDVEGWTFLGKAEKAA